ncbi:MAG: NADPH-dependent FMN reductase [Hyphomicrobiaceae bacterium]
MSTEAKLLFFAGSAREGSFNKKLARLGDRIADANGISATFLDLADYPMPLYDGDLESAEGVPDNAYKMKNVLSVHDGVFIAAPEYNASISPLLKNALDWVSRARKDDDDPKAVFATRVFALGAASPGGTGGIRGLTTVRHTLEMGLGALVLPDQFLLPKAGTAFSEDGHLIDKAAQERLKLLIQKLARAAKLVHG